MVAQLEPTSHRVLQYDPNGHRLGPIATLAAQVALIWGLIETMGALQVLLLPPSYGVLTLMLAMGAMLLAPRRVVREFPISFSIIGVLTISIASAMWTVDSVATQASIRGLIPSIIGIIIVGGLLTLQDTANAIIWCTRIVLVITVFALATRPEARVHVGVQSGGVDDYAGWHGLFNHKNNMTAFLVLAIPTILVFHRQGIVKWVTLGIIAVLMVGSESATGFTAGFFVVVAYVWLVIYHTQSREDARNATLLFLTSLLGGLAVVAGAAASIATVTSAYGKDTTFSGRTLIWEATIDAIGREPWFGHGMGALFWRDRISNETAEIWRQVGFENSHAHNGPLDLILQIGLVGFAILLVLWLSVVVGAWRAIPTQPQLGIWITCIMSANLLMALSEDVWFGGWFAVFGLLKMLLMRREESLSRPSWFGNPIEKWAYR